MTGGPVFRMRLSRSGMTGVVFGSCIRWIDEEHGSGGRENQGTKTHRAHL